MTPTCPVCAETCFQLYRVVESDLNEVPDGLDRLLSLEVRVERCARCGLFRTIHLGDYRSSKELYEEDSLCFDASVSKVQLASARSTSTTDELLLLSTSPPAHLLDVGCGAGQFLQRASRAGYRGTGIDLDPQAVAFARDQLGLDARHGSVGSLPEGEQFDIVTLFGVLEHIADPVEFLLKVCRRVSAGGEVLIGVPNAASLNRWVSRLSAHDWDMFLEPGHLYHYKIGTLTRVAGRARLKLRRWSTGTMTIRGKVPLLPFRHAPLERRIQKVVNKHPVVRRLYVSSLHLLDAFRLGDMLFANFRVGTSD